MSIKIYLLFLAPLCDEYLYALPILEVFYNIPALRSSPTHHGILRVSYSTIFSCQWIAMCHCIKQSFSHRGSHGIIYKVYST